MDPIGQPILDLHLLAIRAKVLCYNRLVKQDILTEKRKKAMMEQPTKGPKIFDQLINAVSSRDEKEALEAAKLHVIDMEKKVAETEKKLADLQIKLSQTQVELRNANAKATALEQRALAAEAKVKQLTESQAQAQQQAAAAEAAKAQVLATHKIAADETLSHLALKYYGHATKPYWTLIYEANKEAIGPNPNKVRPGTELQIPVLPESMK